MANYPVPDQDDTADAQEMNGHELAAAYGTKDVPQQIMAQKEIPSGWVDMHVGHVPSYVYPQAADPKTLMNNQGLTFYRNKGAFPQTVPYGASVSVDPVGVSYNQLLSVIDHELQHVKENREGTQAPAEGHTQSNTNIGRHFGTDQPGQMFDYEGKNALRLMGNRLSNQNKAPQNPWDINQ